ncbi:hypothetical protein LJK87_05725 [Paenibacillus sp. P25]|nr:hypothetical protein LJK87_05725 [Paenibacillus sp. P25]
MRRPQLFGKVNDIPLSYKFMSIYLFCVLLPIIAINILFFERISQTIKARELQNLEISLDRAKKDINGLIEGAVAINHAVATDRMLYEALDKTYGDPLEFYDAYNSLLKDKVNHYMPVNTQIDQISVYTANESIQSGGTTLSWTGPSGRAIGTNGSAATPGRCCSMLTGKRMRISTATIFRG